MKVGIDQVEIERMQTILDGQKNLSKIFCESEIKIINSTHSPKEKASGIYAAKEAVLKAFGIGLFKGITLNQIEVNYLESKKPYILKNEVIKDFLAKNECKNIEISVTHTKSVATSICIID